MKIPAQRSGLYVIDCGEKVYLGQIKLVGEVLFIYTGKIGRPPAVDLGDVDTIVPVEEHPDVVGV